MEYRLDNNTNKHHADCRFKRHIKQRISIRRQNKRVVFKTGELNFEKSSSETPFRLIPDIISKFIDARWRWSLIFCILVYILIWFLFASIWWLILYLHGDLREENLPSANNGTIWNPCIREIYSFTSIFLFSIEIHTTIGYGKRAITLECPSAMLTMCIEGIAGHFTQALIIAIVFAKLTRPKNRAQSLIFSKSAIINQRDTHLCLIFRVGNIRKSRIIASKVNAYLIQYESNSDDDIIVNNEQINLRVKVDACDDILFLNPISVVHRIDSDSPFYNMSAQDMLNSNLEIVVVFEGVIESTGQTVQAISSYTSQEIMWGRRFSQLIHFQKNKQGYVKDFSKFDEMCRVNTPLCRAKELDGYFENRKRLSSVLT
nr:inward rectifier potassium channel 2-like [Vanessa tameamea]